MEILDDNISRRKPKQDLSNANAILALGIVAAVLSPFFLGLFGIAPFVIGVMAVVKGKQAIGLFNEYPQDYTRSSLNKAKAGFVLGIIGLSIWGLIRLLYYVILFT